MLTGIWIGLPLYFSPLFLNLYRLLVARQQIQLKTAQNDYLQALRLQKKRNEGVEHVGKLAMFGIPINAQLNYVDLFKRWKLKLLRHKQSLLL